MKIYIKNMVCPRCVMTVENLLNEMKIPHNYVILGEVGLPTEIKPEKLKKLDENLNHFGFQLLNDPTAQLIEEIKMELIGKINSGIEAHFSLIRFLKTKVFKDYSSLSKLFSQVEGITIEQYFILQKIEKVKELLIYNEKTLVDVADQLGYSSSQHLSSQFKKVTGMSPTKFKGIGSEGRKSIDNIH